MKRVLIVLAMPALAAGTWAAVFARSSEAAPAAEIQRTFVSTSGSDSSPCTRAEPCRGFQAALANTLAGGEVVALDSGGYGPFTVDKSVSVIGAPGVHAAISVFTGDGITVDAAGTDTVTLRNLHLTGLGGVTGIRFIAGGTLYVESLSVSGFSSRGIRATVADGATTTLSVRNSVFRQNNGGVVVNATGGTIRAHIEATRADGNGLHGFWFLGPVTGSVQRSTATRNAGAGFFFQPEADVVVSDSRADGNNLGGVDIQSGGAVKVALDRVVLSHNGGFGVFLPAGALVRIGGSSITGSSIGIWNTAGGVVETFQDNVVRGNGTDVAGALIPVAKT